MSEVKILHFLSGMQAIGAITEEGDAYVVDSLVGLEIYQDGQQYGIRFTEISPFAAESQTGIDNVRIPRAMAFTYPARKDIEDSYYEATRRIKPITAASFIR